VGPFEEEEEGTGITSDEVKVKGAESGHPRSPDLRNDTGTAISPISGQQNKATHTHTLSTLRKRGTCVQFENEIFSNFNKFKYLNRSGQSDDSGQTSIEANPINFRQPF